MWIKIKQKFEKKNYFAGLRFKNCVMKLTKTKPAIIIPKITQEYSIAKLIYKHLKFSFFILAMLILLLIYKITPTILTTYRIGYSLRL
ncbi:hypothetical protein BK009_08755 [Methanobacterium subterraneum]|uniref:Uncharacterized protein n=1 Tax=Methanobacterium subterraneum TaxID=59277 RepID=A0A2H4VRQ3_9EURY|nr:hypothetical protein BK009_08755 [Methanobacterium subterraneum]